MAIRVCEGLALLDTKFLKGLATCVMLSPPVSRYIQYIYILYGIIYIRKVWFYI